MTGFDRGEKEMKSSECCLRSNGDGKNFEVVISLDHGDPKVFIDYWKGRDEECSITISGSHLISYFSPAITNCWFAEPEFVKVVARLHDLVGNAVVNDRHIIVGTGSSQLFQAALYALSSSSRDHEQPPMNVVAAAPYYSSYPAITDFLQSRLYKWAGDANTFTNTDAPYIEVVCTPCNPDGARHEPVVKRSNEKLIHDLAYNWPQYAPITEAADHDLMLFSMSKCTGHAGSRIGWALVKDEEVAKKMINFIELNTIGTSKEAQLRTAKILNAICDEYGNDNQPHQHNMQPPLSSQPSERFFEHAHRVMAERWQRLRQAVEGRKAFILHQYPKGFCQFRGKETEAHPAFAWMECKKGEDGAGLMRRHNVLARGGDRFGVDKRYVRVSMVDTDESFEHFIRRLSSM
ncbi:hypothetical protein Droror1_Dr00018633 [Drosera rotundifolia]